jgi:putative ATPase
VDGLFDDAALRARPDVPGSWALQANTHPSAPLAVRMRPRTLDELVGQSQLRAEGSPLRQLIEGRQSMSVLLWGPPGTGKTTIAAIVSGQTDRAFVEVSAVSAGVKEVRAAIDQARADLTRRGRETVLFVDEVHRFSKAQQDALLPGVENRWVTLVAATTENPFFSVISPLLSRSLLLQLDSLTDADVVEVVDRALVDERGLAGTLTLDDDARDHLVRLAGGDARRALTYLEAAAGAASATGRASVDLAMAETAVDRAAVRYDRQGDQHYDVISAFIKSLRGSDADAALHYLARMFEAGEDPRFIARRLVVLASEDIGLADPTALTTAVAAAQAVQLIGMPEARLNLARSRPPAPMCARGRSARCRLTSATRTTRARNSSATARRTPTATTSRTASPSSSTRPTWSWTPSTTGRPHSVPRRRSRSAGSGSGGWCADDKVVHCDPGPGSAARCVRVGRSLRGAGGRARARPRRGVAGQRGAGRRAAAARRP